MPRTCVRNEQVGQVNSENNNQAIESFDLYVDLSNDSNLPVAPQEENGKQTLYGLSQFDIPDIQVEVMDATDTDVHILQATSTNRTIQQVPSSHMVNTNNQPNSVTKQNHTIEEIMAQGSTLNNCNFINNKWVR